MREDGHAVMSSHRAVKVWKETSPVNNEGGPGPKDFKNVIVLVVIR